MFSGKQWKDWLEKALDNEQPREIAFAIRSLLDDKLIGFVTLWGINWVRAESWLAMAIGEAELWGKGYGTDALQVLLRYAFQELNFRRVSLFTFEYNERALRAYQKCGFRLEGRRRKHINRMGKRWDSFFMGLLKEEWEELLKIS